MPTPTPQHGAGQTNDKTQAETRAAQQSYNGNVSRDNTQRSARTVACVGAISFTCGVACHTWRDCATAGTSAIQDAVFTTSQGVQGRDTDAGDGRAGFKGLGCANDKVPRAGVISVRHDALQVRLISLWGRAQREVRGGGGTLFHDKGTRAPVCCLAQYSTHGMARHSTNVSMWCVQMCVRMCVCVRVRVCACDAGRGGDPFYLEELTIQGGPRDVVARHRQRPGIIWTVCHLWIAPPHLHRGARHHTHRQVSDWRRDAGGRDLRPQPGWW